MNPVLVFLVVIGAIVLWFLLSFIFFPLGKFISRIGKDAMEEMNKDECQKLYEKLMNIYKNKS